MKLSKKNLGMRLSYHIFRVTFDAMTVRRVAIAGESLMETIFECVADIFAMTSPRFANQLHVHHVQCDFLCSL